jgi:hypothetical protein
LKTGYSELGLRTLTQVSLEESAFLYKYKLDGAEAALSKYLSFKKIRFMSDFRDFNACEK